MSIDVFRSSAAGASVSDADPTQVTEDPGSPGTSGNAARADHVHQLAPLDVLTMVAPDGTLFDKTVDNAGAWVTTELDVRVTEGGDFRITESGGIRTLES